MYSHMYIWTHHLCSPFDIFGLHIVRNFWEALGMYSYIYALLNISESIHTFWALEIYSQMYIFSQKYVTIWRKDNVGMCWTSCNRFRPRIRQETDIFKSSRFEPLYQPLWGFWLFGWSRCSRIVPKSSRKDAQYQDYYAGTTASHHAGDRHSVGDRHSGPSRTVFWDRPSFGTVPKWPSFGTVLSFGTRNHVGDRVPGLPISDCARSCINRGQSRPMMSAIDVTAKKFFERLYLVLGLRKIASWVICPYAPTTPTVQSTTISRFPCNFFPRMAPHFFHHDSPSNLAESRYPRGWQSFGGWRSFGPPKNGLIKHSCWPRTVWCVANMFHKNGMRPLIIANRTKCYSILYCKSQWPYIRLKYTYSVISVKLNWLPGNSKKWTID